MEHPVGVRMPNIQIRGQPRTRLIPCDLYDWRSAPETIHVRLTLDGGANERLHKLATQRTRDDDDGYFLPGGWDGDGWWVVVDGDGPFIFATYHYSNIRIT